MPKKHHPKRGSHGYSPRKRSAHALARFRSWPEDDSLEDPVVQGFSGFKAGMTHVMMVDFRPTSTTSGQEVREAVTVLETPPMGVAAVRAYKDTSYGLKAMGEVWADNLDRELSRRIHTDSKPGGSVDAFDPDEVDELRLVVFNRPHHVSSIPRKTPDLMEARIGGGDMAARLELAGQRLGTDLTVDEFCEPGAMLDVAGVTKGKGLQGSVKRFGVKLQSHKNSKNRRDASPLGPFQPRFIRSSVPMPGQVGYHQRTEYNKRVLKIGDDGSEVTPAGGFKNYGNVNNSYVLLHGTIPGPTKRAIAFRHAARYTKGVEVEEPQITYISTASKQGA